MNLRDDGFYEERREKREDIERRVRQRDGNRGRTSKGRASKRRRKRRGRLIFSLLFLVFFVIIGVVSYHLGVFDMFTGSRKRADMKEVLQITGPDEAGLILNGAYTGDKAFILDGTPFVSFKFLKENINDWFYYDENERLLLYTLPDKTVRWSYDDANLTERGGEPYVSLELVKLYTDLEVSEVLKDPDRIVIRSKFGDKTTAEASKATPVRLKGSAESDIVTDLDKGDRVRIISANNVWSTVETEDGFVGCVENKRLTDFTEEPEEAPGKVPDLVFDSVHYDKKVILGWHQVMGAAGNSSINTVLTQDKSMNVISPTWYSLSDTEGGMKDISSADYVAKAHAAGVLVWSVIDNFNVTSFQPTADTYELLSYTSKRQRVIDTLVNSVLLSGADGINVDFENLSGETGDHFTQFIKELSVAAHANGLVLSVDNYVPKVYSRHYRRDVQGKVCDFVIIMGYDEYNTASTEAGPVASIDFVREGIEETLKDVDASKVINGIPFFSRIWAEEKGVLKSTQAVGMNEARQFLLDKGVKPGWDDATGCNYGEVRQGATTYKVWIEDRDAINAILSLMDVQGVSGAAFWKLGMEDNSIWDDISAYAVR